MVEQNGEQDPALRSVDMSGLTSGADMAAPPDVPELTAGEQPTASAVSAIAGAAGGRALAGAVVESSAEPTAAGEPLPDVGPGPAIVGGGAKLREAADAGGDDPIPEVVVSGAESLPDAAEVFGGPPETGVTTEMVRALGRLREHLLERDVSDIIAKPSYAALAMTALRDLPAAVGFQRQDDGTWTGQRAISVDDSRGISHYDPNFIGGHFSRVERFRHGVEGPDEYFAANLPQTDRAQNEWRDYAVALVGDTSYTLKLTEDSTWPDSREKALEVIRQAVNAVLGWYDVENWQVADEPGLNPEPIEPAE